MLDTILESWLPNVEVARFGKAGRQSATAMAMMYVGKSDWTTGLAGKECQLSSR